MAPCRPGTGSRALRDIIADEGISGFRTGISRTARTRYAADDERDYRGERVILGPHLAKGIGAATSILRIYWYEDTAERTFVIGHVGRKLRDDSHR